MMKRHFFPGVYLRTHTAKVPKRSQQSSAVATAMSLYGEWELFTKTALNYIWTAYCAMNGNYIAVGTVVVVLILSLLLPDITQKLHATHELKSLKTVLHKMSNDVKRAEVACLTVADEICYIQCNMNDTTTETSQQQLQDASECMQVTQSEPAHLEKKVGLFRRLFFNNRNTSNKEVTIMSYVYTDSFDSTNKAEQQQHVIS